MPAKRRVPPPAARSSRVPPPTAPAPTAPSSSPVFADPVPSRDPAHYAQPHASDSEAYAEMDALISSHQMLPLPFPVVADTKEPVLRLQDALGANGKAAVAAIQAGGEIVFQAAGDTGATRGPATENLVMHKLLADFHGERPAAVPQFFYHLGDIVYSFGEHKYYYDQFYEAFRDYPRPIFAIPGNHDGLALPPPHGPTAPSLDAFLANFCAPGVVHATDAMGISRTTMTQPGVYFTLDAPCVSVIGLYSNVLEHPGVISSQDGHFALPDDQLAFLRSELTRLKDEREALERAIVLAVHHPPVSFDDTHGSSPTMANEIDAACNDAGVWPDIVLSGHAHLYQRFSRSVAGKSVPYVVAGSGGHLQHGARSDLPAVGSLIGNYAMAVEPIFELGYLTIVVDLSSTSKPTIAGSFHSLAEQPTADSFVVDLKKGTVT